MLRFFRTTAADWNDSERPTARDWLVSLLPRNSLEALALLSLVYWCPKIGWLMWRVPAPHPWALDWAGAGYAFGWLAFLISAAAMAAGLLKIETVVHIFLLSIALRYSVVAALMAFRGYQPNPATFGFCAAIDLVLGSHWLFGTSRLVAIFPWDVSRRMRPKGFPPRKPGRHRILFIDPATEFDLKWWCFRRYLYPITTPYLAALVPEDWDVMALDPVFDEVDFDLDVDVVGITTWAYRQKAFLRLAEGFRARGVSVILGGPEVSRAPEAYEPACDSLLVGDAEGMLPAMLEDWKRGLLRRRYVNAVPFDLKGMPPPRFDLLPKRRYFNMHQVLVSVSCPYHCSFCTYNRTRQPRLRPAREVAAEIRATRARDFWLEAPELLAYKDYVEELERELAPLNIRWATHTTMRSASKEGTVRSAYNAGMRAVWLGVESWNQGSLDFVNKGFNQAASYQETFDLLDRYGISANCHIMMGLPKDAPQDYDETLKGLIRGKAAHVLVYVLGAFAGDGPFERGVQAVGGRPLDMFARNRELREGAFKYYKPAGFSDRLIAESYWRLLSSFYSPRNIAYRLFWRSTRSLPNATMDLLANVVMRLNHDTAIGIPWDFYETVDNHFSLPKGTARSLA